MFTRAHQFYSSDSSSFPPRAPFVSTGHGAILVPGSLRSITASTLQPEHRGRHHLHSTDFSASMSCTPSTSVKEGSHQAVACTYLSPHFPPNIHLPKPTKHRGSLELTASGFCFWSNLPEQSQRECKIVSSCLMEAGHWANTPWQRNQNSFLHWWCALAHLHIPIATPGEQKVSLPVQDESFVPIPHYVLPILSFCLQNETLTFQF